MYYELSEKITMLQYQLECRECGHRDSIYRNVDERDLYDNSCCGMKMKRVISIGAIIYKGSGWVAKDISIDKYHQFVEKTCAEPIDPSEAQVGQEMIKERNKLKNQQRVDRGVNKIRKKGLEKIAKRNL